MKGSVPDDLEPAGVGEREARTREAAGIVTARRRLMLGAAAVLPSVFTLPSGATFAAASNRRCWALKGPETELPDRFTRVPDAWLRKEVHSGDYQGGLAICTTWDQTSVSEGKLAGDKLVRKAAGGTVWAVGGERNVTAGPGVVVENVSDSPDYYALIYVDETASNWTLDPAPNTQIRLNPIKEACWTSMVDQRPGPTLG